MAALDAMRPRHPLEDKGWRYVDPPTKFSPEMWEYFLGVIGAGNYQILAESSGTTNDGLPYRRGQLMVSPAGQQNMQNHVKTAAN